MYDDDDESYLHILKKRNNKNDKEEINELEIEKLKKDIEILNKEIDCINEGYLKLIQILKSKSII